MTSVGLVPKRGLFVVIEGGDACGKNTQATALHRRLNRLATPVSTVLLSFPRYDTPLGQAISRHLKMTTSLTERRFVPVGTFVGDEEAVISPQEKLVAREEQVIAPEDDLVFQCMMTADKYHAAPEISAHLVRGGHVVSDRWWPSAYVYGTSDGLDGRWLRDVHLFLPQADVTVLIDVPARQASDRRPVARDRYEESMAKREEVRQRYLEHWWENRRTSDQPDRWPIVDGVGSVDEVSERMWRAVEPYLAGETT